MTLSTDKLIWIISKVRAIKTVEIIRIAPQGLGKIPLQKQYILGMEDDRVE